MREIWVRSLGWEDPLEKGILLPGESHGRKSLVGYSPWGHKESDTTELLHFHFHPRSEPSGEERRQITISLLGLSPVSS